MLDQRAGRHNVGGEAGSTALHLVKVFLALWLCGWAVGELLVSQVLMALALCAATVEEPAPFGVDGFALRLAADDQVDRGFAVPFLVLWLTAWSVGGMSILKVVLGTGHRSPRTSWIPMCIAWLLLLAAFCLAAPALRASRRCRGVEIWVGCWLAMPGLLALLGLAVRRSGLRRSAIAAARRLRVRRPKLCEVSAVSAAGRLGAALSVLPALGAAPAPGEELVRRVAEELLAMAGEQATCAICFQPLCDETCAVLASRHGRQRICGHYFHLSCVRGMAATANASQGHTRAASRSSASSCPLCRRPFLTWMPLPDPVGQPRAWFQLADVAGRGRLGEAEAVEALASMLPVERERLRARLRGDDGRPALWREWTKAASGALTWEEFSSGEASMLLWIAAALAALRSKGSA